MHAAIAQHLEADNIMNSHDNQALIDQIDRSVDSAFVYTYENTKFVPPKDKKLLIMGQTEGAIEEYHSHFSNYTMPAGWAAYWAVTQYRGITESYRNETGTSQHHQMLVDRFPNSVIHSAMWLVGKWDIAKNTRRGKYDKIIKRYADWAKSTERPIYLRIGYEFDGPHNELQPKEYIEAYKRIVDIIRDEGADNIAFVWHSYAQQPFNNHKVSDWYPGSEYVDWVAISVFDQPYSGPELGVYGDRVLEFAKEEQKPVMVAEANPIRGIHRDSSEVWENWFVHFFSLIYEKNIRAVSFINQNWDKMYIPGIEDWEDARLYNNDEVSRAWFNEIKNGHFLNASPKLFEKLGYD
jgi:beta-mannanase